MRFGQRKHPRVIRPTSRAAFVLRPDGLSARILERLRTIGPATDAELEAALHASHQAVSADRRHLVERDLVHPTSGRRPTPSGRPAIVWAYGPDPTPRVAPVVDPSGQVALFGEGR